MIKLLALLITLSSSALAYEKILDFHTDIHVLNDGDIHVTETIKIRVENLIIRHGIYRDTPTVYLGAFLSHQKFNVVITDVKLNGKYVDYSVENLLNGIRLKIGSKDYYVKRGIHTYTIKYITRQQIKNLDNNEGLYWNVTGTGWILPIVKASADIYMPDTNKINILTQDAWTGPQKSTEQNFTSKLYNDHIHFETTRELKKHEGLTIQATWPSGVITNPKNQTWIFIKNNFFWLASILMLFLYPWYFYNTWKNVGIDPPKQPVYPLFNPPNDISPAAMKFVRSKYYDSKNFSVAIMSLAAKNFISIEQITKKKYILTKQNNKNDKTLSKGEKVLFNYLFDRQKTLTISNKYNSRIETATGLLEKTIVNEHQDAFYKDNNQVWLYGVAISLVVLLLTWIHFFNFSSYWLPYLFMPVGAILASTGIMHFAKKPIQQLLAGVVPAVILVFVMVAQSNKVYIAYLVLIIFIILLNALFHYLIQAPTVFGQNLLGKIEGFRMYLNTAEQDRLDLMNPPEMTPKLFEKYLPYALALDVENRWSEQFDKAMKIQGKDMKNYHPDWYIGNSYSNFSFSTTASSIGAGLATSVVSASTPPAPSGGSGGFGGGGGFSGGGGGGGGGGGW